MQIYKNLNSFIDIKLSKIFLFNIAKNHLKSQQNIEIISFVCYNIKVIKYLKRQALYMARSYNKLWKMMIDKKMNKTQLRLAANISTNAMAKLGRDESVPIETLEKICNVFKCTIDDVMDFISEE